MDRDQGRLGIPAGFTTQMNFAATYFSNGIASKAYGAAVATGTLTWSQPSVSYAAVGINVEILPP